MISLGTREGPEEAPRPSINKVANTSTTINVSPLTQQQRVRAMLERGWTCGIAFLEAHTPILRYTGRIHELRMQGWQIDRRACQHPWHDHRAQMWEWRIVGHPGEPRRLTGMEL